MGVASIDTIGIVIFGRHGLHIRAIPPAFAFRTRMSSREQSCSSASDSASDSASHRKDYGAIQRRFRCPVIITYSTNKKKRNKKATLVPAICKWVCKWGCKWEGLDANWLISESNAKRQVSVQSATLSPHLHKIMLLFIHFID